MKLIPLTQGKFAQVDDKYYNYLMQWSWYASFKKGRWYALRHLNQKTIIPMQIAIGRLECWNFKTIDHHNGDGLDNQVSNLRPATNQQQNQNQKLKISNSTGFKGVSIDKTRNHKKFAVHIRNPETGKKELLGRFITPEQAAHVYDHFARLYYKEFACVNFPKEGERLAI